MRGIVVPGIDIRIPVIGFGCSSLASAGRKHGLQLLGTAFDAGARHFDVARYYGYGEAEGLLGGFIKSRRAEVTITTKFGIDPPRRTSALRLAMQAGRKLAQLVPAARGILRRRAQGMVTRGGFSAEDARRSLETSLRELGTDYIDFFLLHEYSACEDRPHELLAFLTNAASAGKIRNWGLGTGIESILRALERQPELCRIAQFENSVLHRNWEKLPKGDPRFLTITHGSLGDSYRTISARLKTHSRMKRTWSEALGVDCSRDEIISSLMLNSAVQANPNGLILFSSKSAARVSENIRAVLEPELSTAQVDLFGQLVKRDVMQANPAGTE